MNSKNNWLTYIILVNEDTTSYEEQPLSDKTLSRFRKRCYEYESSYGIDLLHDCVADLSNKIVKMMNLSPRMNILS